MSRDFPFSLAGQPARKAEPLDVTNPCDDVGREGPRYTIEEMTGPRLLVINRQIG